MNTSISMLLSRVLILTSVISIPAMTICQAEAIKPEQLKLTRLFPVDTKSSVNFDASIIATSVLDLSQERLLVIVPASNGVIAALDAETGGLVWKLDTPTPEGQEAQLISTPVKVGSKLVILYQCLEKGVRTSHRLAVVDLLRKKWDDSFPVLTLSAEKPAADSVSTVKFNPPTAYSHAAVKHMLRPGSLWGSLYAAFGNAGDIQPFHGWMFEIDMDAWQKNGAAKAISNVLVTTPEAQCPVTLEYATQEMICGGGIWGPAGPQIYPTADSFEIVIATGNGQVDLTRHDYANALMRVQPGLKFEDGCDVQLCKNFNQKQPDTACIASCKNLFIPRPPATDPGLKPSNRECEDKTFWECLAWMDYDLGASSPVKVELSNGQSVLVQPGKDGAVYLLDAKHFGTQYERLQIAEVCGTPTDICKASWMGMIVTQPVTATINKEPIVVIPTFIPDKSHPAGLIALKVVLENGTPKFKRFWQFPVPSDAQALQTFRSHPSLPIISTLGRNSDPIVWIVDIGPTGTLYGVRIKDGALIARQSLLGTGRQLSAPLIFGDTLYLASMMPGINKATIEAYRIETRE